MMKTPKSQRAEKFRLYKLAVETPNLQVNEIISPSMTISHLFTTEPTPPTPPPKQNGTSPVMKSLSPRSEHIRQSLQHGISTKGALDERSRHAMSPSPTISEVDSALLSPGTLSNGETPVIESTNQWSSAVGRATTGGKSGRVIERLMNDNDRLLREKKLAIVKLEEEVKRGESARSALESLQISNANLISMHESDTTLLAKRDRRIQQLRDDLEVERSRREKAERETRDTRRERDDTIERLRREAGDEKEQCLRATSQYDTLSKSWKGLEDRYLRQTERLKSDLAGLHAAIDTDRQKLSQMEIIMEQMAKEADKTRRAREKLSLEFESYKAEQEAGIQNMRKNAEQNDAANNETHQQMVDVLGQMKYVINIRRDLRDGLV